MHYDVDITYEKPTIYCRSQGSCFELFAHFHYKSDEVKQLEISSQLKYCWTFHYSSCFRLNRDSEIRTLARSIHSYSLKAFHPKKCKQWVPHRTDESILTSKQAAPGSIRCLCCNLLTAQLSQWENRGLKINSTHLVLDWWLETKCCSIIASDATIKIS